MTDSEDNMIRMYQDVNDILKQVVKFGLEEGEFKSAKEGVDRLLILLSDRKQDTIEEIEGDMK